MEKEIQFIVNSKHCAVGLAVIVSNDYGANPDYANLDGTKKDGDAMASSFAISNFAIVRKHNTSLTYLLALLDNVGTRIRYHKSYRVIAFVFAGHGEDENTLITSEGKSIGIEIIVRKLSPSVSNADTTQLGEMVRLFFIDACRGTKDDLGILITPRGTGTGDHSSVARGGKNIQRLRIPSEPTNILIAYSTVSGYRSYEVKGEGGIWLQCLAKKLVECNRSISDVLIEVRKELMKKWQENPDMQIMNPESINRLNEPVNLFQEKVKAKGDQKSDHQLLPVPAYSRSQPTSSLPSCLPPLIPAINDSTKCKPNKVQLAPTFSNSPITPLQFFSPGAAAPQYPHCNPPAIPPRIPVLSREVTAPKPFGFFRGKINEYKARGIVQSYNIVSIQGSQSFHSRVTCILRDGKEITGDSSRYYQGRKGISEDKATEDALNKIDDYIKETTQSVQSRPNQEMSLSPKDKVYKGKLNNLLFQMLKRGMPDYKTTDRDSDDNFQCTVSHLLFGSVSGSKFPTKKEAENSAAWRAWSILLDKGIIKYAVN